MTRLARRQIARRQHLTRRTESSTQIKRGTFSKRQQVISIKLDKFYWLGEIGGLVGLDREKTRELVNTGRFGQRFRNPQTSELGLKGQAVSRMMHELDIMHIQVEGLQ